MKYFIRSLKYFVALCVICVAILALMLATGTSALTLDQTVYVMFHTSRYATLFAAIVVLAALYPKFGFVVRKVEGDVEENREQIINAFKSAGFSLRGEEDGVMTFRADGPLYRRGGACHIVHVAVPLFRREFKKLVHMAETERHDAAAVISLAAEDVYRTVRQRTEFLHD